MILKLYCTGITPVDDTVTLFYRYYIGCMGYPSCKNAIWLPDYVLEASVEDSICQTVCIRGVEILKCSTCPRASNLKKVTCPGFFLNKHLILAKTVAKLNLFILSIASMRKI
jgi:hypothetical protein